MELILFRGKRVDNGEWVDFSEQEHIDTNEGRDVILIARSNIAQLMDFTNEHFSVGQIYNPDLSTKIDPESFKAIFSDFVGQLQACRSSIDEIMGRQEEVLESMQENQKSTCRLLGRLTYVDTGLELLKVSIPTKVSYLIGEAPLILKHEAETMYQRLKNEWEQLSVYDRSDFLRKLRIYEKQRIEKNHGEFLNKDSLSQEASDSLHFSLSFLSEKELQLHSCLFSLPGYIQDFHSESFASDFTLHLTLELWEMNAIDQLKQFIEALQKASEEPKNLNSMGRLKPTEVDRIYKKTFPTKEESQAIDAEICETLKPNLAYQLDPKSAYSRSYDEGTFAMQFEWIPLDQPEGYRWKIRQETNHPKVVAFRTVGKAPGKIYYLHYKAMKELEGEDE